MNFKYAKLRGRIVEKYGSFTAFSKILGQSNRSVSLKLCGKTQFNQMDVIRYCDLLDIPITQAGEYFFSSLNYMVFWHYFFDKSL